MHGIALDGRLSVGSFLRSLTLVLEDDARIDEWAFLEGLVHDVLEGDDLAATDALVSSYHLHTTHTTTQHIH